MKFLESKSKVGIVFLTFVTFVCLLIDQTNASVDVDEVDDEDMKPAKQRKKEAVSSSRGKQSEKAGQLNTEDLISESEKKPENKHISTTLQQSADSGLNVETADSIVGETWHNWCGCGDMNCERFTKCKLKEFQPLCCENKCKCVKVEKAELEDYWKSLNRETTCKLMGCDNPLKSSCYDVAATEFNCWTQYNEANADETIKETPVAGAPAPAPKVELTETEPTTQFAYFGCGS